MKGFKVLLKILSVMPFFIFTLLIMPWSIPFMAVLLGRGNIIFTFLIGFIAMGLFIQIFLCELTETEKFCERITEWILK